MYMTIMLLTSHAACTRRWLQTLTHIMKPYFLLIATLFFISCNSQSTKSTNSSFDKGTFQGNTFSNNYFGFKLEIDSLWHILNKAELNQLIKERTDMLDETTGKTPSIAKGVEILLSLTIDTIENMPHVLISSLDLNLFPKIKTEKDYLEDYFNQVKKMYENYDVQITTSEIGQETIGTKPFFTTIITIKAENFLAYQKRYSIKIKNELLNIMTNYNSDTYSKKCLNLINNIKWK